MRILAYIIILANRIFASSHGREIPNFLEIVAGSLFNDVPWSTNILNNYLATIIFEFSPQVRICQIKIHGFRVEWDLIAAAGSSLFLIFFLFLLAPVFFRSYV